MHACQLCARGVQRVCEFVTLRLRARGVLLVFRLRGLQQRTVAAAFFLW
jgi:hypothetical protein